MKRKKKRDNCGQFLKFLSITIWLEDAVNQPFPYKCFCSISISGSPCGWYYLLPTIQTTRRQHNYVVTLTLSFFVVLLIPTAPSQAPQEYAGPFCVTLPFSATVNTFLPQFCLSLQHHSTATVSLLSAHHKGIFISQAKLTITHWKSAETKAGMEKQKPG